MVRFSPKQEDAYYGATSRIVAFVGAVRSGKSYVANWKFMQLCTAAPEGNLVICGKNQHSIKRNVVEELQRIFGDYYIRYQAVQCECTVFGRKVHCIGANDERSTTKIKGATFSGALVDEATEMPETFFQMLNSRLSRKGAQLILTTNPDSPFHWLKRDWLDRSNEIDIKQFNFYLDDNPSLDESVKDELKRTYRGLWYKRYILGQWCLAEGSVYDFFNEEEHTIEEAPSYAKYFAVGVDYGTTNPCAFVMVGFNDDVQPYLWVEKEYYFNSRSFGYQKTDSEYAQDLKEFINGYPVKRIYIDPSAASFRLELKRSINTSLLADAKNDVLNGIRQVGMHLSNGTLKIKRECRNLLQEIQSYVWDPKKTEKGLDQPIKAHDHALDALRYVISSHFGVKPSLKETTTEEKQVEWAKKMYAKNPMTFQNWWTNPGVM